MKLIKEKPSTINVVNVLSALEVKILKKIERDQGAGISSYIAIGDFLYNLIENEGWGDYFKGLTKDFLSNPDNTYWLSENVNVYKVRYTSSRDKDEKELSGVVLIPDGTNASLPIISFQHGTALLKRNAPSLLNFDDPEAISCYFEAIVGVIFAAKGNIVLMPDYPGMGVAGTDNKGSVQPYMCAKPLACSVADLIKEVKQDFKVHKIISKKDFVWNQELFLMGYSQGGYVTMSAVHEIQENQRYSDLNITASAPMAGPYSLSKAMRELMLREEWFEIVYFLPLTIRGFYATYKYNILNAEQAFRDVFTNFKYKSSFFDNIYGLMDYANDCNQSADFVSNVISDVMKRNGLKYPRDILSHELIGQLEDQNSEVYKILIDNDVSKGWKPSAPMYLYHCPNDDVVPFENSLIAEENFKAENADVPLVPMFDLPIHDMVHAEAYPGCAFSAYEWFKTFENEKLTQLQPGGYLLPGQVLTSKNYHFRYQLDGNLSMYETQTMKLKWQIATPLEKGGKFILNEQTKALELYDGKNRLIWALNTNGNGNSVEISESGGLTICDSKGAVIKTLNSDVEIKFDAAFKAPNGKVYIFMGNEYLRYSDSDCAEIDDGFPKLTQGHWGDIGDFNNGIDAVFTAPNGKTYMFKGNRYIRYSDQNCSTVDEGFPRNIQGNWGDIRDFNNGIDAIFTAPNGKTYMFKGNQYLRYSDADCLKVDDGFPKLTQGHWGDIGDFSNGIDAVFTAPNGKTYMFKGNQYIRYSNSDCNEVDEGYPKSVKGNWGLY